MKGIKDPLQISDLGKLSRDDLAAVNYRRFQRFWAEEVKKKGIKDASIGKVIFRAVRTKFIASAILMALMILFTFVGPVCLLHGSVLFLYNSYISLFHLVLCIRTRDAGTGGGAGGSCLWPYPLLRGAEGALYIYFLFLIQ